MMQKRKLSGTLDSGLQISVPFFSLQNLQGSSDFQEMESEPSVDVLFAWPVFTISLTLMTSHTHTHTHTQRIQIGKHFL
jgi:hypothetical protein